MKLSIFLPGLLWVCAGGAWLAWSAPSAVVAATSAPIPSPSASVEPPSATQIYAGPHPEFLKALKPLPVITLKPEPHLLKSNEVEPVLMLVSVDDAPTVTVRGTDGKDRGAKAGDQLTPGETFQTGEKATARVAFEGGVQILVPPGAAMRLNLEAIEGRHGGLEVPTLDLERGEVRFLVESDPRLAKDEDAKVARNVKFLVRTRGVVTAVQNGAHGTDAILVATDDRTNLYVVSGEADVAREVAALGTAKSIRPGASESVETASGRPLFKPEHYEMGVYLKDFNNRYPRMEALWNLSVREPKVRSLRPLFQRIRTLKADAVNLQNGFIPTPTPEPLPAPVSTSSKR